MKNERILTGITDGVRERKKEIKKGRAKKEEEGSFGTRKLEMITHLLNLYSTLLSLRRKKKGEVFRLLLLLLPLLPLFFPRRSLGCILKRLPLSLRRVFRVSFRLSTRPV